MVRYADTSSTTSYICNKAVEIYCTVKELQLSAKFHQGFVEHFVDH